MASRSDINFDCKTCGGYGYTCAYGYCPECLGCMQCSGTGIDYETKGKCVYCPQRWNKFALARQERYERYGYSEAAKLSDKERKELLELIAEQY